MTPCSISTTLASMARAIFITPKYLFIACLFWATSSQAEGNVLPDLGSPDLVEYDSQTEQKLGRAFTASLHRDYKIYDDLQANYYIRRLGHHIASYAGVNRNFSFYIIDDPSINAFAGPDGVIGIHTGLIEAATTEDELAAVIAHEISHVTQNHLSRRYEYASTQGNINSMATLIAAILIGMHDPNAGMATLMGGMGYNLEQHLKNSRIHEHEADRIGISLLHQAGYNPHAMASFFERLSKKSSINTQQIPEILRTHPVSDNRLAEAKNRAMQLTDNQRIRTNNDFALIKLKVMNGLKQPKTSAHACYSNALQQKKVTNCLKQLALKSNDTPIYMSQYLEVINKQDTSKQLDKALQKKVQLLLELFQDNSALLINYARVLSKQSKREAIKLLEKHLESLKYQHATLSYLSEFYAQEEDLANAYYYLARAYLEIGETRRAQHYIKQASTENTTSNNAIEKKITIFKQKHHKLLKKSDKTSDK